MSAAQPIQAGHQRCGESRAGAKIMVAVIQLFQLFGALLGFAIGGTLLVCLIAWTLS